ACEIRAVIVGRCVAALRGSLDAEDGAQDVKLRLWRELSSGKRYPVPFRGVVHNLITWTLGDYFGGRDTTVPLPADWLVHTNDPIGELDERYSQASLLAKLPERQ